MQRRFGSAYVLSRTCSVAQCLRTHRAAKSELKRAGYNYWPLMASSFISPHVIIATYASQESSKKWLVSGTIAVVFLGIIALLFLIAAIAFAKYWFLPKLNMKMCKVGGRCDDCPWRVRDSGGGNGTSHSSNCEISIQAKTGVESFLFSTELLRDATGNFCNTNILVEGVHGTVYRGELGNGTMVAIQSLPLLVSCIQEMDEVQARISFLAKVRQTHLVPLLGYGIDGSDMLLVYEYEHLGTLSRHLFDWKKFGLTPLSWVTRLNIALDVARGLEFLHGITTAQHGFIHGRLDSSNVLLDYEYNAKVFDYSSLLFNSDIFTNARLGADIQECLPPEYDEGRGSITKKTDVFGFGLMLMELITGSKAFERAHAQTWAALFRTSVEDDESLQFRSKYVDQAMVSGNKSIKGIWAVAKLALNCIESNIADSPEMSYVINILSSLLYRRKMSFEETQREDTDMDMSLSEALKKWQAFDENSIDSETFQVAKCPVLRSSHPKSSEESNSSKEMESS